MATETAATHDRNKQNQIQGHHIFLRLFFQTDVSLVIH